MTRKTHLRGELIRLKHEGHSYYLRLTPAVRAALLLQPGDFMVVRVEGRELRARRVDLGSVVEGYGKVKRERKKSEGSVRDDAGIAPRAAESNSGA